MTNFEAATAQGIDAPAESPAHDPLAQQARATPDRVLLEVGSEHITYGEMSARVDRLAQWLLENQSGPGRPVGLQTSGTGALALGALALRRAGMIPVPLDPTAPAPWVGRALADAGATLLLSDVAVASADIPCAVVHPDSVGSQPPPGGVTAPPPPIGSITYTSGSTGDPKGVIQPLPNPESGDDSYISLATAGLEPEAVRIGFFGYGSVGFMQGIVLMAVKIEATIVAYDIRSRGIHGLGSWLAENRIWCIVAVPTMLRHFVATMPRRLQLPDLRLVFLYGEAPTWEDITGLWPHVGPQCFVISLYGSTEAGGVSLMVLTPNTEAETGRLPAGFLTGETTVTIEDDDYRPLTAGEVGEIVVWTETGGQGYWNRPEETARVFGSNDDGRHFIRTGDLGRFRPDGLLEQIGRMDDMVKVSGHRVMLSEIEQTLRQLPGVVDAAAAPMTDAGGNVRIITYVVPQAGTAADATVLRAGLSSRLPSGAVPDRVLFVEQLPMLANGKVDRSALRAAAPGTAAAAAVSQPDAQGDTRIVAYVVPEPGSALDPASLRAAPSDRLPGAVPDRVHLAAQLSMLPNGKVDRMALREGFVPTPAPGPVRPGDAEAADEIVAAILAIWSDILGVEAHEDDDFFDLGGDSLRAARLFAEIELQLGADLPMSLLVEASTPRTLAGAIVSDAGHDHLVVPVRTAGSRAPLFIVHDLTGSVLYARVIAEQLDEDQPVYAIQGDAMLGVVTGAESIQEVAARYLPGVLATAPDACALYGSSAGGVIAFELALQLADKGVDVTFLGLGDSFGPGTDHTAMMRGLNPQGSRRLRRRLDDLRTAPWSSRPRLAAGFLWQRSLPAIRHRLVARRQRADDVAGQAIERARRDRTPLPRQFRAAYGLTHYGPLSVTYRPGRPFGGSITLLRTRDDGPETRGWSDYVTGSVRVFPLPDFHYQLHEEETLRRTGELLDRALRHG